MFSDRDLPSTVLLVRLDLLRLSFAFVCLGIVRCTEIVRCWCAISSGSSIFHPSSRGSGSPNIFCAVVLGVSSEFALRLYRRCFMMVCVPVGGFGLMDGYPSIPLDLVCAYDVAPSFSETYCAVDSIGLRHFGLCCCALSVVVFGRKADFTFYLENFVTLSSNCVSCNASCRSSLLLTCVKTHKFVRDLCICNICLRDLRFWMWI